MANVYVLYWFDVEDCTVTQSDDAAKRLGLILEKYGVRGTMKLVGQKARLLEQRVRYDVIDVLKRHDIGFHSNWHGLRPQIAEYLAALDWDEGVAEFERREWPGVYDVRRIFGTNPKTYGQPGSNWAPHVFPVLRRWEIPTYVSGFGYVGVDCQPFWYGGVLCTSHMYGKRFTGEEQRHLLGLNFELGKPGELEKHKVAFSRSLEQLSASGGLISIANHPCTLVLEQWFSTYMKPRELTEAGYQHFEDFVKWSLSHPNVKPTCASELLRLYPDKAKGRIFTFDELREVAAKLREEINFLRFGEIVITPAEAFGMLVNLLADFIAKKAMPKEVRCEEIYNPTAPPKSPSSDITVSWGAFCAATQTVRDFVNRERRIPNHVQVGNAVIAPRDFLAAVARIILSEKLPDTVQILPAVCKFEQYVDEAAARSGWKGAMLPPNFEAPKLIELAKLEAWTLKPAILSETVGL